MIWKLFSKKPQQKKEESFCPYCGYVFDTAITSPRKCPECKEKIFIRKYKGEIRLLTEQESKAIGRQKKQNAIRNNFIRRANNIGFSKEEFENREKEMLQSYRVAFPRDVFWWFASTATQEAMEKGDFHRLKIVHFEQAKVMFNQGAPFIEALKASSKAELMDYKRTGVVEKVKIWAAEGTSEEGGACKACKEQDGQIFTIADALKKLPIPHENCKNGFCQCTWLAVIEY